MNHPSQLTPLTAWQSVVLLEQGATIQVREHSPYGESLPSEQDFTEFNLSMIEGRYAISSQKIYQYLLTYYEAYGIQMAN